MTAACPRRPCVHPESAKPGWAGHCKDPACLNYAGACPIHVLPGLPPSCAANRPPAAMGVPVQAGVPAGTRAVGMPHDVRDYEMLLTASSSGSVQAQAILARAPAAALEHARRVLDGDERCGPPEDRCEPAGPATPAAPSSRIRRLRAGGANPSSRIRRLRAGAADLGDRAVSRIRRLRSGITKSEYMTCAYFAVLTWVTGSAIYLALYLLEVPYSFAVFLAAVLTAAAAAVFSSQLTRLFRRVTTAAWFFGQPDKPMSAADLAAWQSARTLADLGKLTAQWLERRVASQPGYTAGCGPDPETAPLITVLAAANRAGFITCSSQPGYTGASEDTGQRAAVEGFAGHGHALTLIREARTAGLTVVAYPPVMLPRRRYRHVQSVAVTRYAGQDVTWFGVQVPRGHITSRITGYGICHRDAVDALCGAWQITIIDPQWGRNTVLWDTLAAVSGLSRTGTPNHD